MLKRYQIGRCWARKYTNRALVLVNPTLSEQQVQIDEGVFLNYSDNRKISGAITLPAQSGRILLKLEEK